MLQNAKGTAFTVSNLLRENQWGGGGGGGKITPPPPLRLRLNSMRKYYGFFSFQK